MSVPQWPGDTYNASFQNLAFNPSTNVLTLSPFGNSVVLNTSGGFVTSTINSSTINSVTLNSSTINAPSVNSSNIINGQTINTNTLVSLITNTSTINSSTINVSNTLNASTINVSSINGINPNTYQWINPASPINVSTLASSSALVPVINFSTVAGHTYQVNFEYASSNVGGGAAADETTIPVTTELGGHVYIADSFITDQTYVTRYATPSVVLFASGTYGTINVVNETAGGNVQTLNFYRLWTRDLGTSINQY